jgi:hypothetical protein
MGPGSISAFTRVCDALWAGTTEGVRALILLLSIALYSATDSQKASTAALLVISWPIAME